MAEPLLSLRSLTVAYGAVAALHGVNLQVAEGEVVALIGPNGAGKSTLLRAITGLLPARGAIDFDGEPLLGRTPEAIVRQGIAHVPEGRRIFPGLSVLENLEVAAYAIRLPEAELERRAERVLATFPRLKERRKAYGWSLSGGEQQMLAIGRALMVKPRLLLLDEPSLGLAPRLVSDVFATIAELQRRGTTILLVEQNARVALGVASRAYVLEDGRIVREGPAADLRADPAVVAAYLGGRAALP